LESDPVLGPEDGGIILANCGYGSWWWIDVGEAVPSILTPRMLLDGTAQIGIPIEHIQWQAGYPNGSISRVTITEKVALSDKDKEKYDLDWVQKVEFIDSKIDQSKGYVIVKLKKLDSNIYFKNQSDVRKGKKSEEELSTFDKEEYLSDHRKEGKNDCIVPGFGCVRIPLMMEIDFTYQNKSGEMGTIESPTYLARERQEVETTYQRQCWDVEVAIDKRIITNKIPEAFLRDSIKLLNETISAINQILKPLNTIKEIVFYTCAAAIVADFGFAFQESYNCEFSEALKIFQESSDGKTKDTWKVYYAQTGQCKTRVEEGEKRDACLRCEDAIKARKDFERNMKLVCDRIFCPSAPTFMKYVRDMSFKYKNPAEYDKKERYRSDCSMSPDDVFKNQPTQLAASKAVGARKYDYIYLAYDKVSELYQVYKDEVNAQASGDSSKKCSELHKPDSACCGYEYMSEWDSACMLMDEFKESKCIALEDEQGLTNRYNSATINDPNTGMTSRVQDSDCTPGRALWNSVAGFCEPDGSTTAQYIPVNDNFKQTSSDSNKQNINIYVAGENPDKVWFRAIPDNAYVDTSTNDAEGHFRYLEIGKITDNVESAQKDFKVGESSKVSSQRVFEPELDAGGDLFEVEVSTMNEKAPRYEEFFNRFKVSYKKATGRTETDTKDDVKIKQVYRYLQERLGVSTKEYVVDPTSGFLRSVQCVCLPGITSYLGLWKRVLEAVKICFQSLLTTGDGSSGVCKAVLSIYICDLIYDLIACFAQKYGSTMSRSYEGGIGSFMGALTSAGQKVSQTATNRYGETSIWKSLFAEEKLVHAVCLWAFTGTWDYDISAVLEEDISTDVQSIAFLYPCKRRFVSFNPAREGMTTYNYDISLGMVAGSQLSYQVELICSDDYSCTGSSPTGECDCIGIGRQTRTISIGPGYAERGQTIDKQETFNVVDAPYRYDKARLKWSSADSDKSSGSKPPECKIGDTGSRAPAFCKLESGRFACNLGFGDEDYIRFVSPDPTPTQKEFNAGESADPIRVSFTISQRQPKEATELYDSKEDNPYTKYLRIKLYNQFEEEVTMPDVTDRPIGFNGNGLRTVNDLPNYKAQPADFMRRSGLVSREGPISSVKVKEGVGEPAYKEIWFRFKTSKDFEAVKKETVNGERKITQTYGTGTVTQDNFIFFSDYIIQLTRQPNAGEEMYIKYDIPTLAADTCTSNLVYWKLNLTFYDKGTFLDDISDQVSSYQGQPVTRTVNIPMRCKKLSVGNMEMCYANAEVTRLCLCGLGNECKPPSDSSKKRYCNYYDGVPKCEDHVKDEAAYQAEKNKNNNAPSVNKVEYVKEGGAWSSISNAGIAEISSSELQIRIDASDSDAGDSVRKLNIKVGDASRDEQDYNKAETITIKGIQSQEIKITITVKDTYGKESSPFEFTLKKKNA
jgi:hypothetical protein